MAEIISSFLNLSPQAQKEILRERNKKFGSLSAPAQDEFIRQVGDMKQEALKSLLNKQIPEDAPESTIARDIFDFTKKTAEVGADVFGGALGSTAGFFAPVPGGTAIGGVLGAGSSLAAVRSFFNGIEGTLGVIGVEGFDEPKSLSDTTFQDVLDVGKQTVADFAQGAQEEALGGSLIGAGGFIKKNIAPIAGGIVGSGIGVATAPDDSSIKDKLVRGATGFAGGFGVVKAGQSLGLGEKAAQEAAASKFKSLATGSPVNQLQVDSNIEAAKEIERLIPGIKFDQGQLTDSASAVKLVRELGRFGKNDISQSSLATGNRILQDFFDSQIVKGGDPQAFLKEVEDIGLELATNSKVAEDAVTLEVARLKSGLNIQSVGENILKKLEVPFSQIKEQVGKLFDKIPNVKLKTKPLQDSLERAQKEASEGTGDIPKKLVDFIERSIFDVKAVQKTGSLGEAIGQEKVTKVLKDANLVTIRRINDTINNEISKAVKTGDNQLARRLNIIKDGISGVKAGPGNEAIEGVYDLTARLDTQKSQGIRTLQEANALRVVQRERFRGNVGKVLGTGPEGEVSKVASANIGSEFNSPDAIDQLVVALESKKSAKEVMRNFFQFDLLSSGAFNNTTGAFNIKPMDKWLADNALKLKKLGLLDEFKGKANLQRIADTAADKVDIFRKSIAGRIIDSSVDDFVKNSFSKDKNLPRVVRKLLALARGNKNAQEGLRTAIAKHLNTATETTEPLFFQPGGSVVTEQDFVRSVSKFTSQIKKLAPVFDEIYKGQPKRRKALDIVAQGYQITSRTAQEKPGGGTETAFAISEALSLASKGFAAQTVRLVSGFIGAAKKFGEEKTNKYLRKAVFDPDYAETLIAMVEKRNKPIDAKLLSRFNSLMAGLVNQADLVPKINDKFPDRPEVGTGTSSFKPGRRRSAGII